MMVEGAVALVTGANRGIGAALVEALVEAGASRVYAATRAVPPGRGDGRVIPIALDVTDPDAPARAAREHPDVQVLINNAGVTRAQPLVATSQPDAAWDEMRVNYFGTLAMVRAFAPVLARSGGGAIVNMLSILGRVSGPRVGSYSASKAAAFSLTQGIRGELASQGTLVIGVMPGLVDTDMTRGVPAPKLPASAVAASVIDALRRGIEDVYPGAAAEVAEGLLRAPKSVERQFAALFS